MLQPGVCTLSLLGGSLRAYADWSTYYEFLLGVLVTEVCTMSLLGDADDWRMY